MSASEGEEAAVVSIWSAVSMFSLMTMGMPYSGPRTSPRRRSPSSERAMSRACGFTSMIELSSGPRRSSASMRCR